MIAVRIRQGGPGLALPKMLLAAPTRRVGCFLDLSDAAEQFDDAGEILDGIEAGAPRNQADHVAAVRAYRAHPFVGIAFEALRGPALADRT